jgi:multidrug efflux pump subunit AcrA (membrane-fusion protein)
MVTPMLASSSGKNRSVSAVLAAFAALALASCGSRNTFVAPPPPKVAVAQPVQEPVTLYLYLTGNTAPFRTTNLVARVQGYLESIDYQDGATVKKEHRCSASSATSIKRRSIKPKRNWPTIRRWPQKRRSI